MISLKTYVYEALVEQCPGASVSDEYPREWKSFPKVTFTEENNAVELWTDNAEQFSRHTYRVDVWDNQNTTGIAAQVDSAMAGLGFLRIFCMDVPVQENFKHKQMRYECVVDNDTLDVFHD